METKLEIHSTPSPFLFHSHHCFLGPALVAMAQGELLVITMHPDMKLLHFQQAAQIEMTRLSGVENDPLGSGGFGGKK